MTRFLEPGKNCCHVVHADRFAMLVDGSSYYAALAEAIARARRSVVMVGWDLDSRVQLGPRTARLRDLLPEAASRNPDLRIYILTWDFPLLFANVRDPKLVLGQDPFEHPRIFLKFDKAHPAGASHHQKIVAIDGCLAFAGGMDVAGGRWDTPQHRPDDPRRGYPSSHDVQGMFDGEAAAKLAEIANERWQRATGESITDHSAESELWPAKVKPDLTDVRVGISLTNDECREIEHLHVALIEAARRFIYIENQYLTSPRIVALLARRLDEAHGPEIVIVLPRDYFGWLEAHTIEILRFRAVRRLRQCDRFNRLRVVYPDVEGSGVGVHSKVLIVDDVLFRVGSSNLTNRSMRLDTECDLTIEAVNDAQREAIASMRNRLLGEHLGLSTQAVAAFLAEKGLVRLVDSRSGEARCLRELPAEEPETQLIFAPELVDPSAPLTAGAVAGGLLRLMRPVVVGAAAIAGVTMFWRAMRARPLPHPR